MSAPDQIAGGLLAELEQEAMATERMLERVPGDKLSWRPHERSMSLGQLALHVATIPGSIANFLDIDSFDVGEANFDPVQPESLQEILDGFAKAQTNAKSKLEAMTDGDAASEWRLTRGEEELWALPKGALARTLMFNHLYHHRGQLSVYLRLLGASVPATYGRSADESAFG